MPLDFFGAVLGLTLSVAILSYVIGDNPLYRVAVHLFIGAAAGYAVVVAAVNVILPQLVLALFGPLDFAAVLIIGVSWLLALLLLLKLANTQSALGRLPVAYLVGLGAAVAVGGAVTGTLFPQTAAAFVSMLPAPGASGDLVGLLEQPVSALVLLLGTVSTLMFFWYGGRSLAGGRTDQPVLVKPLARVGQVFIGTALGVLYAGVLVASLAYLAERLGVLWEFIRPFVGG
jgi:hypothetical protein